MKTRGKNEERKKRKQNSKVLKKSKILQNFDFRFLWIYFVKVYCHAKTLTEYFDCCRSKKSLKTKRKNEKIKM